MRRTAILAAGAAVLALPQAATAKPVIDNEGHAYLTITLMGQHATGKNERLEVESWHWGTTRSGGNNQLKLDDSAGTSRSTSGRVTGVASDPPEPTGRGVDIARVDGQISPGPGTLTIRASFRGCQVGKRYGGMQFAASGMSYVLSDVRIVSCGPGEEITFVYGTVRVRGWDPKKKEL